MPFFKNFTMNMLHIHYNQKKNVHKRKEQLLLDPSARSNKELFPVNSWSPW